MSEGGKRVFWVGGSRPEYGLLKKPFDCIYKREPFSLYQMIRTHASLLEEKIKGPTFCF